MTRLLFIALLAGAAVAGPALAQTVTVAPGLWQYDGTASLGPASLVDEGTECFEAGESTYSLGDAAASIAPGCALASATQTRSGFDFTIACTGELQGELAGQFTFNQDTAQLTAKGWTGAQDQRVDVSVSASASRIAPSCS